MIYTIIALLVGLLVAVLSFTCEGEDAKRNIDSLLKDHEKIEYEREVDRKKALKHIAKKKRELYTNKTISGLMGAVISVAILAMIPLAIVSFSYDTYIDARSFSDATHSQYKNAITIYADYAAIDLKAAFTDSKHEGYQKNIADFIRDFRNKVIEYNEIVVEKGIWKQNKVFGWFIISLDPGMKEITMK